jgi:hypothetical protein
MTTLRKLALVTAKLALAYILCGGIIVTANADTLHTWQVEYDGNYYTYVADRCDNPNAYIIDLDGNKIYVTAILRGETE